MKPNGFIVSGVFVDAISKLPTAQRRKILDAAFLRWCGVAQEDDENASTNAIISCIVESANLFAQHKNSEETARSSEIEKALDAARKWLKRNKGADINAYLEGRPNMSADVRKTILDELGHCKDKQTNRKLQTDSVIRARVDFDTVKSWADTHFCPPPGADFIRMWHSRMEESGWVDSRGHDLIARGTWQRELSVWWNREKEKNSAARAASASVADGGMMIGADGLPLRCGAEPDLV